MPHDHALFMHTYLFISFVIQFVDGAFLLLSLSLIVYTWHPSLKLLRPETLFGPGHYLLISLLYMSSSKMRKLVRTSRRTSPNMAFIQNATLSYRNSPILLYPLSFIVEVGNLYVRYS